MVCKHYGTEMFLLICHFKLTNSNIQVSYIINVSIEDFGSKRHEKLST